MTLDEARAKFKEIFPESTEEEFQETATDVVDWEAYFADLGEPPAPPEPPAR